MTSDPVHLTYEELRNKVAELQPAGADLRRSLVWGSSAQVLAASRGIRGEVEIFIVGPPLATSSQLVGEILSHDTWKRVDGSVITASRLVLPPTEPFDAIATFLCTELLRNGVDTNPQRGLAASEPIIETVLQRLQVQGDIVVGLIGELLVILQLIRTAPDGLSRILASWYGPSRSSRDLQLGGVGIEVKTTRGATSRHHIQGVRQVEVGHGVGGVAESLLFLISVGLEPAEPGGGNTLPGVVDAVLNEVREHGGDDADALIEQFLVDLTTYGSETGEGYDHLQMRDRAVFAHGWSVAFCRTYDMADPAVLVLRSEDVLPRRMVDSESMSFQIVLPEQVVGDANPIVGLSAMAARVVAAAGLW